MFRRIAARRCSRCSVLASELALSTCGKPQERAAIARIRPWPRQARRRGRTAAAASPPRVRAEPRTFNRFASQSFPTHLVSLLTDAPPGPREPGRPTGPSRGWPSASPGTDTTLDITLRPGLHFSDGTPATADDVVWSLKAAYATPQGGIGDVAAASTAPRSRRAWNRPRASSSRCRGRGRRPSGCSRRCPSTRARSIEPALAAGTFAAACATSAPCPGLGPFVVVPLRRRPARRAGAQPALLADQRGGRGAARTWMASRWRSCRTRTRSCCGSPAGRRI